MAPLLHGVILLMALIQRKLPLNFHLALTKFSQISTHLRLSKITVPLLPGEITQEVVIQDEASFEE